MSGLSSLKNELRGVRGTRAYKLLKSSLSRLVGRAFWYDHLTAAVEHAAGKFVERGLAPHYYEFGTGSGNTLQRALVALRAHPQGRLFLFDSFAGLPSTLDPADAHVSWNPGDFAYSEDYIKEVVGRSRFDLRRATLVKGFFHETLTPELRAQLASQPPAFVTVDVDYCSSTRTVLEFLTPILVSGCCFYFDDLWAFDGHPEFGQLKAIADFNRGCKRGQLVANAIFQNRVYTYYNYDYEFLHERPASAPPAR